VLFRSRIDFAEAGVRRADADLVQAQLVHGVKIAGTYLELLAARALIEVSRANLSRAQTILESVSARTRTGLSADVDRSLADAEVSRAKLALIDAQDRTQQLETQLSVYIGEGVGEHALDARFLEDTPVAFGEQTERVDANPELKLQDARITEAEFGVRAAEHSMLPSFSLVAAYQARASGFDPDYTAGSDRYTLSYFDGVRPRRSNYVIGITLSWNLMSLVKNRGQIAAQTGLAETYRSDRALTESQLDHQRQLADQRIANVQNMLREVPHQYAAADAAYRQKNALYSNGLSNMVEVQQALYALNRAEADRSVSRIALWRALLQKAAAVGDYHLFSSQLGSK
jgi:outer membrane protein TolC